MSLFLRRKIAQAIKRKRKVEEPPPAVVEQSAAPTLITPCPAFEDFGADAQSLFSLDLVEGCRVVLTKSWSGAPDPITSVAPMGGVLVSHTVNLGTYPKPGSQADILRALLQSSAPGMDSQQGPRGGHNWATLVRWANSSGRHSVLGRYSSLTQSIHGRAMATLSNNLTARANFVTGQFTTYFGALGRIAMKPSAWKDTISNIESMGDMASVALERTSLDSNITVKASYQDSPIYTLSFANRILPSIFAGADITLLKSTKALLTSYGLRYQDPSNVGSVTISASPNFEKPMAEGIKERVYSVRANYAKKTSDRVAVSGEVELPLSDLTQAMGKVGYEIQFAQARVLGCLDSSLRLQTTVEDASGLQFSGDLDFPNDNYKFGFGFELVPQQRK